MIKFYLFLLSLFMMGCSSTPKIKDKPLYPDQFVSQAYLQTLDFKDQELIVVPIDADFYYIRKDGKKMLTLTYDNGADEFSDGLARTRINGKIGFFNRNLEIILPPVYDFAFPFHNGFAEICMGCQEKKDGEHSILDGGEWKKINREGLVIE